MTYAPPSPGGRRRGGLPGFASGPTLPAALALLLGTLAVAAGCAPGEAAETPGRATGTPQFSNIDEEFAHVATVVPGGFGGWYYDEQGRPNVFLRDLSRREEARAALMPFLRGRYVALESRGTPDVSRFVFHQGQYDYRDLLRWCDQITTRAVQRVPGVVTTDVLEQGNRVEVAVTDDASERQVRAEMARLEIPAGAVVFARRQREREVAGRADGEAFPAPASQNSNGRTLIDRVDTLAGGYRVWWPARRGGGLDWDKCTVSFVARWSDPRPRTPQRPRQVFVTNSHCTGGTEIFKDNDKKFFQGGYDRDATTSGFYIGTELNDTSGHRGNEAANCHAAHKAEGCCPVDTHCRWSDAAVISFEPRRAMVFAVGRIARVLPPSTAPAGQDRDRWNLRVNRDPTVYHIRGEIGYPEFGETMWAVGATSGLRSGRLIRACINTLQEPGKLKRCQYETNIVSHGGDSGSPVFSFWRDPANPNARHPKDPNNEWVYLRGVLWGGLGSMSAMRDIELDLGEMDTFDCAPPNPDEPNCRHARHAIVRPAIHPVPPIPVTGTYPIPIRVPITIWPQTQQQPQQQPRPRP